jgi:flagellar biosynthesis protein FlhF
MMKFIASNVDAAKAKARRALGDQVTIVSVRTLPSGDVEVSASSGPAAAAPPVPVEAGFGDYARQALNEPGAARPAGARLHEPLEQKYAQDALARLSTDLSGRRQRSGPVDLSDRTARAMADALRPHSFSDDLIAALIEGARKSDIDDDLNRLETALAETFDFAPVHFSPMAPILLVGPTGAGKTSCGAKLAAAAINRGSTAFIMSADVGRAGAIDQIKAYGDALGADYYITETPQDVAAAIRAKRPTGAVLLDTPGISPYDPGDFAALRAFQEATNGEAVLVLPASGDPEEFRDWAAAFREFGAKRLIITKFDATRRVGAALSAAFASQFALAHFSQTPFISEGLLDASPDFLARRLVAGRAGRIV